MHGGDDESPDKRDEKSSEDKTEKTEKTEKEVLIRNRDQWEPFFPECVARVPVSL